MLNKVKFRYVLATLCSLVFLNTADITLPLAGDRADLQLQTQALAKKSGGRSGGGSFRRSRSSSSSSRSSKSRSSSSPSSSRRSSPSSNRNSRPSRSSSSPRRSSPSLKKNPRPSRSQTVTPRSSSPSPNRNSRPSRSQTVAPRRSSLQNRQPAYRQNPPRSPYREPAPTYYEPAPTYREYQEPVQYRTNRPTRSYPQTSNTVVYRDRATTGERIFFFLLVLLFSILLFLLLFMLFKKLSGAKASPVAMTAAEKERDNDTVTLSKLQVGLLVTDGRIQEELSQLSLNADTDSPEGLWDLLQESLLVLQRNADTWTYVLSDSESAHVDTAEAKFQQVYFQERSKFSEETLSNIDGELETSPVATAEGAELGAYVVVTLLLGTADDKPLLGTIRSTEDLKAAIAKLASMRSDYLMTFYLLWTPQEPGIGLSDDEMIMEFTDLYRLS